MEVIGEGRAIGIAIRCEVCVGCCLRNRAGDRRLYIAAEGVTIYYRGNELMGESVRKGGEA
jgi:hypothetical protein